MKTRYDDDADLDKLMGGPCATPQRNRKCSVTGVALARTMEFME